jgi:hypothetical protein
MGWWIVKQPNGRLARFSDAVDNFTHMNLTEVDAVDICKAYLSLHDSFHKVQLALEDAGLHRWADALMRIEGAHGRGQRSNAENFDHFIDTR